MSDIKRYTPECGYGYDNEVYTTMLEDAEGGYIKYVDHQKAVQQAFELGQKDGYKEGYRIAQSQDEEWVKQIINT